MFGSRPSIANAAAWPRTAFVSAEGTTVAKESVDASRRIVAAAAPAPKSVTVPLAASLESPPERKAPVPDGGPGDRVVKETTPDSPATPKEFLARSLA